MIQRRQLTRLALAMCTSLGIAPAFAQPADYPSKPLTIVVPFVPGGPVDVMARTLGDQLARSMKVAVVIDNRAGAGGIESPPAVLPHIRAGKMRALAIAGPERLDSLPDVPTTTEAGLPGLQIVSWFGLVAPAGTPAAVIDKLNKETLAALKTDDVRARFERLSIRPMGSTPAALATLAQQDRVKWGQIVKASGVRLD